MRLSLFSFFFMACFCSSAQVLIRNVQVVDVKEKKIRPGRQVLITDGKILAVDRNIRAKMPEGTTVIDGSGKYLMPGLVDAHVHFFQSGGVFTRPDVIDLRKVKPYEEEIAWTHRHMEDFLRRYTAAGITTVVDVGATIRFLKQRDSFRTRPYAPDIYMTGPLLTTWEPQVYKNLGEDEPFLEMKSEEDARRFVRQQLPYRPDFIKIWYIVLDSNTGRGARKTLPMVTAAIDEAHKNGLRVAVHATEQATARLAVEAGADLLVHGIDDEPVDAAFLKLLKSKGTVVSPTLVVAGNYAQALGQEYPFTKEEARLAHPTPLASILDLPYLADTSLTARYRRSMRARAGRRSSTDSLLMSNTRRMQEAGIILALGTDAGNIGTQHASSFFEELEAMRSAGLDPWQLLQAATINGARAVGREAEFGSVEKGKKANLLLLSANPLDSLGAWSMIEAVISKGKLIDPDTAFAPSPADLAQQQLNAYNAHDLEAFLAPYADDVEIYGFPDTLQLKGKEAMRRRYEFITRTPGLFCVLQNRIVQGNTVIDHEKVYRTGSGPIDAIAVYTIENGKISKVHFIR